MVNQELFFYNFNSPYWTKFRKIELILSLETLIFFFFFFSFNILRNMDKYVSVRTCLIELALHYNDNNISMVMIINVNVPAMQNTD